MWNFMKILPVAPDLFHAGGKTERLDKANSRFLEI